MSAPAALPASREALLASITDPRAPAAARGVERWADRFALPFLVNEKDVVFTV